jgi:histone-lysine N-methyltransferase SETD2/UMP-CMP kinase
LTKCLCGAKKCKGYLGLKPIDITAEEWNERLEDMICELCLSVYQNDD